jgi:hypothetical protein
MVIKSRMEKCRACCTYTYVFLKPEFISFVASPGLSILSATSSTEFWLTIMEEELPPAMRTSWPAELAMLLQCKIISGYLRNV